MILIKSLVLAAAISAGWDVPRETEAAPVYRVMVDKGGFYAFGEYLKPGFRRAGQTFRGLEQRGYGLGYMKPFGPLRITVDVGRYEPDVNPRPEVRNEAIRHIMRHDYGKGFRPKSFSYDIEPSYGVSIGAETDISSHLSVYARYRALKYDETMQMWSGRRHVIGQEPDCNCWWIREDTVDVSSFQAGLVLRF